MGRRKVLIASRQTPDIESMLTAVPPEVEVHFLPPGELLQAHVADVEILFGHIAESELPAAGALRWVQQPHAGIEGCM